MCCRLWIFSILSNRSSPPPDANMPTRPSPLNSAFHFDQNNNNNKCKKYFIYGIVNKSYCCNVVLFFSSYIQNYVCPYNKLYINLPKKAQIQTHTHLQTHDSKEDENNFCFCYCCCGMTCLPIHRQMDECW